MAATGSIFKSTLLLTAANLTMRGVSMLFQVYLTGEIGAAGIGLLQLIMTVHGFSITLGTSGLRVAAMYLSAEEYGLQRPAGIRNVMGWCLAAGAILSALVGSIMFLGAEPLALNWVKDLRAVPALRLLGLTLPLTCLSAILAGYFTAIGQVGRLVIVEIADRMATVGATAQLLTFGTKGDLSHACLSIVGGGALASLASVIVLLFMMAKNFRKCGPHPSRHGTGRRLCRFCIPIALNDYLRSGLGTLEQFLIPYGLTRFGGTRTGALADYGTIQGMVFPLMMLPCTVLHAVSDLLVPELALSRAQNNRARIRHMTEYYLERSTLFSATAAGLLFLLADPLGFLLYRSQEAGFYLRLFAPLIPILYLDCIVDGMHKGLGQQIYCVRVNTLTNFLDVIGLFLLLPRWGIGGYFFTFSVTHCLNFYLSLRRLLQISDAELRWRFLLMITGCTITAVIICRRILPLSAHVFSVITGGGVYLAFVICLILFADTLHPSRSPLIIEKNNRR